MKFSGREKTTAGFMVLPHHDPCQRTLNFSTAEDGGGLTQKFFYFLNA